MSLTQEQKETLEILKEQLVLPKWSTKIRVTIMSQLLDLGLVELRTDKHKREFWYPTELGKQINL